MFDRAWQVPEDEFVKAWNSAKSLDEAAARVKELAGGAVPRWAVMARAMELRIAPSRVLAGKLSRSGARGDRSRGNIAGGRE